MTHRQWGTLACAFLILGTLVILPGCEPDETHLELEGESAHCPEVPQTAGEEIGEFVVDVGDGIVDVGAGQDCDGVFVSCTNLRVGSIIEEAEKRLSKPVISSNQALAWHMLRLAGINDSITGKGQLLKTPL